MCDFSIGHRINLYVENVYIYAIDEAQLLLITATNAAKWLKHLKFIYKQMEPLEWYQPIWFQMWPFTRILNIPDYRTKWIGSRLSEIKFIPSCKDSIRMEWLKCPSIILHIYYLNSEYHNVQRKKHSASTPYFSSISLTRSAFTIAQSPSTYLFHANKFTLILLLK